MTLQLGQQRRLRDGLYCTLSRRSRQGFLFVCALISRNIGAGFPGKVAIPTHHQWRPGPSPGDSAVDQASSIVTAVMATGESGKSRLLRGAAAIASTTSMPVSTWPKRV